MAGDQQGELAAADPAAIDRTAADAFAGSSPADDRSHLHVVAAGEVPDLARPPGLSR